VLVPRVSAWEAAQSPGAKPSRTAPNAQPQIGILTSELYSAFVRDTFACPVLYRFAVRHACWALSGVPDGLDPFSFRPLLMPCPEPLAPWSEVIEGPCPALGPLVGGQPTVLWMCYDLTCDVMPSCAVLCPAAVGPPPWCSHPEGR
jgi:hypothetical protein